MSHSSESLIVQSQQKKLYKKVWNMFKVNNENARNVTDIFLVSLLLTYVNILWTYFTPLSIVSIVDFEQVNITWDQLKYHESSLLILLRWYFETVSKFHL